MAALIKLHPETPHQKRVFEIADRLRDGAIMLFPTDTQWALGCDYRNKKGIQRIRQIRGIDETHLLTLLCDSLNNISKFGILEDRQFKIIKRMIPGAYTFVLPATKELPKLMLNPKRNTIGFRVPDYPIVQKIVESLNAPIVTSTAKFSGVNGNATYFREDLIRDYEKRVDLVIDNQQELAQIESTVLDLTNDPFTILRSGSNAETAHEILNKYGMELV